MSARKAPPPPVAAHRSARGAKGSIVDVREKFARKRPQTAEDKARAHAFIDGKIEMIRRDPTLTDAEKSAAIAELEAKREQGR